MENSFAEQEIVVTLSGGRDIQESLSEALLFLTQYPQLKKAALFFEFFFHEYWKGSITPLTCGYLLRKNAQGIMVIEKYFVTPKKDILENLSGEKKEFKNKTITVNFSDDCATVFAYLLRSYDLLQLKTKKPLLLSPVSIPKPWGQEIWFTGIEKRGVSEVIDPKTQQKELLPYILAVMPPEEKGISLGQGKQVMLVKILDPLPVEVVGDLYYELHREKNEVYIVTAVDSAVNGKIRIGVNPDKLTDYKNKEEFRAAFLKATENYYAIRVQIDALFDEKRKLHSLGLNDPLSPEKLMAWTKELPTDLREKEKLLRDEMDSFKGTLPLYVGDVVNVPIHTPHSLCHGVRVIEFQTPTYERLILNFAQKVLTQKGWNTEEGLAIAQLEPPTPTKLRVLKKTEDYVEEEVCSFQDFSAFRITAQKDVLYKMEESTDYRILFNLSKQLVINENQASELFLRREDAVLLPAQSHFSFVLRAGTSVLVTVPK